MCADGYLTVMVDSSVVDIQDLIAWVGNKIKNDIFLYSSLSKFTTSREIKRCR